MNKQDYDDQLEDSINLYESEDILPFKERLSRLKNVVQLGREYNTRYKNPHKHYFMGKPIKYSNMVLDALDKLITQATTLNDK